MYFKDKSNLIIAQSPNKGFFDYLQTIIRKIMAQIAYRSDFIIFRKANAASILSFKQLEDFIEINSSRAEN